MLCNINTVTINTVTTMSYTVTIHVARTRVTYQLQRYSAMISCKVLPRPPEVARLEPLFRSIWHVDVYGLDSTLHPVVVHRVSEPR